jgi:hypothetical protein
MFEQLIDALFRQHGYATTTNAMVVGSSGARHEIDVLAVRRDDLLEARVGVECKNWAHAIDTAVVARARLVRDDAGLGQVVIACPGGATPAARRTAAEAGIALWDRAELDKRLGPAAIAALRPARVAGSHLGAARRMTAERSHDALRRQTRGAMGIGRGEVLWSGDAWLPVFEVRFGCGVRTGLRRQLRVRPAFAVYDGWDGTALWDAAEPVDAVDVADDAAPVVEPSHSPAALANELTRMIGRTGDLVQDAARERHDDACRQSLIPDAEIVTVDDVRVLVWPVTMAVVRTRRGDRAVVVDAVVGKANEAFGERVTARLGSIARELGISAPER